MTKHTKNDRKQTDTFVDKEIREVKREWRHFLKFGDENRLLFAAFVVVITGFLIVNTIYIINRGNSDSPATTSSTAPDTSQVLTSLDAVSNGATRAQISDVSESDKIDPAFTLPKDETLLTMKVLVANQTSETQHLIPVNMFYVRSDEGDYSPLHPSLYATSPLQAQDVKPGGIAEGQISFAVPKRVSRPLLYIDTGWGNFVPFVYDVLH